MAKFYYKEVLMPEIPADKLEEFPYAMILLHTINDTVRRLMLILSKYPYYFELSDYSLRNVGADGEYAKYDIVYEGKEGYLQVNEWTYHDDTALSIPLSQDEIKIGIHWFNYDIYSVRNSIPHLESKASDAPVPEFPYEMYEIKKTTLVNIADKIKSKIGNTEPIKVSNFANTIESIAPKLQSKVATENGNCIPDEGYDGLKYVSVNVPEKEINLQNKVIRTNGIHSADSGYDGFGEITVVIEGVDTNSIFATMTNNVELTAFVPQYTSYINEVIMEVN